MVRHPEYQYLDLIEHLVEKGDRRIDRTGVGTLSTFGAMMRFDLSDGTFPVYTTKRVFWKTAVKEMLWFLTGQTNIQALLRENVRIWTDWPLASYRKATGDPISQEDFEAKILADDDFALKWGDLGPVYGKQWRRWVDAHGNEHDQMALHPCHMTYQFYVSGMPDGGQSASSKGKLSLLVGQRSCDIGLGNPFNIAQQAALLYMVAQQVDMVPSELVWVGGDVHLYLNHIDYAQTILSRVPKPFPKLRLVRRPASIDDYRIEDFVVTDYDPHPAIDVPVAV